MDVWGDKETLEAAFVFTGNKEIYMEHIDIEKIMTQIRAEIKEKGYTDVMLSFNAIPIREPVPEIKSDSPLQELLVRMRACANVVWNRPLPGGVKGMVKRVFRKLTSFFVVPIVEDQNVFNTAAVSTLEGINAVIDRQSGELERLEQKIQRFEQLEQRLWELEQRAMEGNIDRGTDK